MSVASGGPQPGERTHNRVGAGIDPAPPTPPRHAGPHRAVHRQDVAALLRLILEQVAVHATAAATDSKNWGYAGDLGHAPEYLEPFILYRFSQRLFIGEMSDREIFLSHLP